MKHKMKTWLCNFKPPLFLSCILAVVFSAASLVIVSTSVSERLPDAVTYAIYICAALSLSLAVWAIIRFVSNSEPKEKLIRSIRSIPLTGKLVDDYSFRTVTATYLSFVMNALFAVSKGVAGWFSSSFWLITFAAYYLILCIAKMLLLRNSRKLSSLSNENERLIREWKSYRVCGMLLMFLTVVLQGVVVLIMKDGNHFTYYGVLILVVAMYDFYCLITAIVYMIKTRKKHSPTIVAIKSISFATSLVSMLSLQTAMFASYGGTMNVEKQNLMNLLTGSAVSLILLALGVVMVIQANKKIKQIKLTAIV